MKLKTCLRDCDLLAGYAGAHTSWSVFCRGMRVSARCQAFFIRASSFLSVSPLLIFIRIGLPRASPLAQCILKAQKKSQQRACIDSRVLFTVVASPCHSPRDTSMVKCILI